MSKKQVTAAVEPERQGNRAAALEKLAGIADRGFIRRRLAHLSEFGGEAKASACSLFSAWEPERAAPPQSELNEPPVRRFGAPEVRPPPREIVLAQPEPFLAWATWPSEEVLRLADVTVAELWGLVGLGSLAQAGRLRRPPVETQGQGGTPSFAHALGLQHILLGQEPPPATKPDRTVPLRRVTRREEIQPAAQALAGLIVPAEQPAMRRALAYVFLELLRNVIQHSQDPLGGVVGAQRNDRGPYATKPVFQVAVADSGIGIPESLRRMHRVDDPREALERALWPHISGTFPEGLTGSGENAGLGLFFIAEMAKLAAGRMLVASRDAALMLIPRLNAGHDLRFLKPDGTGFPGTLVAFEVPIGSIRDFDQMTATIHERARERTPARAIHHWVRFEDVDSPALVVRVADLREDTSLAAHRAESEVKPAILSRGPVVFDFDGVEICTQSFLHALLFEAVRLAWAVRATLHAIHAAPAVRSGVEFLERYALGG
jgi:anti-sigma regulatory factor (Ser/Thr protein kinase)